MALDLHALGALAATRHNPGGSIEQGAGGASRCDTNADGMPRFTLQCRQPEPSSAAVGELLLTAFAAESSSGRASQAQPAARIAIPGLGAATVAAERRAAAAAAAAGGEQQPAAAAAAAGADPLVVQFTAASAEPAAEAAAQQAAQLFEAYWQHHLKAAKSDLHCRMRQRLAALRQQLLVTKFD